jgi:hypothetical protein
VSGKAGEAHSLEGYSPFRLKGHSDPSLVRELLPAAGIAEVTFNQSEWRKQLERALASSGIARVVANRSDERSFQRDLFALIATPVNVDFLRLFPSIDAIERTESVISVTFVLREWAGL